MTARAATLAVAIIAVAVLAAAAQPVPVVGFLGTANPEIYAERLAGIRRGLSDAGYVEGRNVTIEYRWADNQYDRLPALAAELVRRKVAVIVTSGSGPAAQAARAATSTIPIVFTTGSDPVKEGLVASLSRPGGNATGVAVLTETLAAKRLEVFREVVPRTAVIGVLVNPANPAGLEQVRDTETAAGGAGPAIHAVNATSDEDLERAFATLAPRRITALIVVADPTFNARRARIVALAQRHAIAAVFPRRDFVVAGGLMSYGPRLSEVYRQQGVYIGRILKGAKPTDLPVVQATKLDLVINHQTARTLGLEIPATLLARADEVIE